MGTTQDMLKECSKQLIHRVLACPETFTPLDRGGCRLVLRRTDNRLHTVVIVLQRSDAATAVGQCRKPSTWREPAFKVAQTSFRNPISTL